MSYPVRVDIVIVAVALAVAFASGVDPRRLLLLAGAVYLPAMLGAMIALLSWRARPDQDTRPALLCEGVASELRSGASLRDALAVAATSVGISHIVFTDVPIAEVAARVAGEFPGIGEELRLTVINAARSGSDAAGLFDEIGSLAIAQAEIAHEIRVATAPGRATAMILVGAPVLYVAGQLGSGGLGDLLASSQQRFVTILGLGLFLVGLSVAILVVTRARR